MPLRAVIIVFVSVERIMPTSSGARVVVVVDGVRAGAALWRCGGGGVARRGWNEEAPAGVFAAATESLSSLRIEFRLLESADGVLDSGMAWRWETEKGRRKGRWRRRRMGIEGEGRSLAIVRSAGLEERDRHSLVVVKSCS
jgi:hypothetical protein